MAAPKPKVNRKGDETKVNNYDQCLTPPYALEPLLPYLQKFNTIWEPACGQLHLVTALLEGGIGAAKCQAMMQKYGAEIMLLDGRVNFHMPEMGWGGDGSQFPVLWYCWKLLPEKLMFGSIKQAKKQWEEENKDMILVDKERVAKEKLAKKLTEEGILENV